MDISSRQDLIQEAAKLWNEGIAARKIADILGVTPNTISGFTRDRNLFNYRNTRLATVAAEEKPTPENTIVEDAPNFPDPPEGSLFTPWIDLESDQCQFSLEGFWAEPSNAFPCCGLPVSGKRGIGKRFCEYHRGVSLKDG